MIQMREEYDKQIDFKKKKLEEEKKENMKYH